MKIVGSKLNDICGLLIHNIELGIGVTGLIFENGASLTIYNNYKLEGAADPNKLIGAHVSVLEEEEAFINIKFDKELMLRIDMRDEAYNCPEALQLRLPSGVIVVWN